jgi:uncharacterized membrane protein YkgB
LMIQPWIAHSPFLSWLSAVTDIRGASMLIGVIELIIGVLLALHHWLPSVSVVGGVLASIQSSSRSASWSRPRGCRPKRKAS